MSSFDRRFTQPPGTPPSIPSGIDQWFEDSVNDILDGRMGDDVRINQERSAILGRIKAASPEEALKIAEEANKRGIKELAIDAVALKKALGISGADNSVDQTPASVEVAEIVAPLVGFDEYLSGLILVQQEALTNTTDKKEKVKIQKILKILQTAEKEKGHAGKMKVLEKGKADLGEEVFKKFTKAKEAADEAYKEMIREKAFRFEMGKVTGDLNEAQKSEYKDYEPSKEMEKATERFHEAKEELLGVYQERKEQKTKVSALETEIKKIRKSGKIEELASKERDLAWAKNRLLVAEGELAGLEAAYKKAQELLKVQLLKEWDRNKGGFIEENKSFFIAQQKKEFNLRRKKPENEPLAKADEEQIIKELIDKEVVEYGHKVVFHTILQQDYQFAEEKKKKGLDERELGRIGRQFENWAKMPKWKRYTASIALAAGMGVVGVTAGSFLGFGLATGGLAMGLRRISGALGGIAGNAAIQWGLGKFFFRPGDRKALEKQEEELSKKLKIETSDPLNPEWRKSNERLLKMAVMIDEQVDAHRKESEARKRREKWWRIGGGLVGAAIGGSLTGALYDNLTGPELQESMNASFGDTVNKWLGRGPKEVPGYGTPYPFDKVEIEPAPGSNAVQTPVGPEWHADQGPTGVPGSGELTPDSPEWHAAQGRTGTPDGNYLRNWPEQEPSGGHGGTTEAAVGSGRVDAGVPGVAEAPASRGGGAAGGVVLEAVPGAGSAENVVTIKQDDTIWALTKDQFAERFGGKFSNLPESQRNTIIANFIEQNKNNFGHESFKVNNVHLIHPGEKLDFGKLFANPAEIDKLFSGGRMSGVAEIPSGSRGGGMVLDSGDTEPWSPDAGYVDGAGGSSIPSPETLEWHAKQGPIDITDRSGANLRGGQVPDTGGGENADLKTGVYDEGEGEGGGTISAENSGKDPTPEIIVTTPYGTALEEILAKNFGFRPDQYVLIRNLTVEKLLSEIPATEDGKLEMWRNFSAGHAPNLPYVKTPIIGGFFEGELRHQVELADFIRKQSSYSDFLKSTIADFFNQGIVK